MNAFDAADPIRIEEEVLDERGPGIESVIGGLPGTGKATIANALHDEFGWPVWLAR